MTLDDTVCWLCGVPVARSRSGLWLHTESLPEKTEDHEVEKTTTRRDYLFGESQRQAAVQAPTDRSVAALERQAEALEEIRDLVKHFVEIQLERERRAGWRP